MCLADFASSYVSKKVDYLPIEPDEIKSYTVAVFKINDVKLHRKINILKNELGEMQKCEPLCLCMSWNNENEWK